MGKKLKLTLDEMISYVDDHSTWLNALQLDWFRKIRDYYLIKKFLSPKQRKILSKCAGQVFYGLQHSSEVAKTKRVCYQSHNINPIKDSSGDGANLDLMSPLQLFAEIDMIGGKIRECGEVLDKHTSGLIRLSGDQLSRVQSYIESSRERLVQIEMRLSKIRTSD